MQEVQGHHAASELGNEANVRAGIPVTSSSLAATMRDGLFPPRNLVTYVRCTFSFSAKVWSVCALRFIQLHRSSFIKPNVPHRHGPWQAKMCLSRYEGL